MGVGDTMNFEKLLSTFDMGICADQMQREAVFDLVMLFAAIDGEVAQQEETFIANWIDESPWNSGISTGDFQVIAKSRVEKAMEEDNVEGFIKHRAEILANTPAKDETKALLEQLIAVDGNIHQAESQGLAYLNRILP